VFSLCSVVDLDFLAQAEDGYAIFCPDVHFAIGDSGYTKLHALAGIVAFGIVTAGVKLLADIGGIVCAKHGAAIVDIRIGLNQPQNAVPIPVGRDRRGWAGEAECRGALRHGGGLEQILVRIEAEGNDCTILVLALEL